MTAPTRAVAELRMVPTQAAAEPMARHAPADADELAVLLADRPEDAPPLLATGRPVEAEGGSRAGDVSAQTPSVDVLSTARMAGVVEVRPRDLTVTVEAGARVRELLDALADRGLWCALAGTALERSVGGLVAAAPWGPLDASHGDLRRQLLACEVVTHDGERVRWGRAVLKDVAGYGMTRVVAGSWGTLGVVHRATFRLWPAPASDRLVPLDGEEGDLAALAGRIADSDLDAEVRPDAVLWRIGPSGEETIEVRLIGTAGSVDLREERLRRWAAERGARAGEGRPWEREAAPSREPRPRESGASWPRDLRHGRTSLAPGRGNVAAVGDRVLRGLGDRSARLEADLLGGRLRVEYRRRAELGGDDGDAFRRLLEAAGDVPVRVERGTEAEIERAEARRSDGVRRLERRVREALSGRPRHWLSAYL